MKMNKYSFLQSNIHSRLWITETFESHELPYRSPTSIVQVYTHVTYSRHCSFHNIFFYGGIALCIPRLCDYYDYFFGRPQRAPFKPLVVSYFSQLGTKDGSSSPAESAHDRSKIVEIFSKKKNFYFSQRVSLVFQGVHLMWIFFFFGILFFCGGQWNPQEAILNNSKWVRKQNATRVNGNNAFGLVGRMCQRF